MLTFRDHLTGPDTMYFQSFYSAWTTESMPWMNKCFVLVLPSAFSVLKHSVTNTLMSPLHVHHACLFLKQHRCELPSKVLVLPWKDRLWVQAHMTQKSWRALRMGTEKDLITILMPPSSWLTQLVSQGHSWLGRRLSYWTGIPIIFISASEMNYLVPAIFPTDLKDATWKGSTVGL